MTIQFLWLWFHVSEARWGCASVAQGLGDAYCRRTDADHDVALGAPHLSGMGRQMLIVTCGRA